MLAILIVFGREPKQSHLTVHILDFKQLNLKAS
jgi:hypothetical protein